jgi:hypothetical protein
MGESEMAKKSEKPENGGKASRTCLCPYCETEVKPDVVFCKPCGNKFVVCPRCGKTKKAAAAVCPHCSSGS